jgi:hypothetical protein
MDDVKVMGDDVIRYLYWIDNIRISYDERFRVLEMAGKDVTTIQTVSQTSHSEFSSFQCDRSHSSATFLIQMRLF